MLTKVTTNSVIAKIMGTIVLIEGIAMIVPWIWAEVAGEMNSVFAFRICVPVTLAVGLILTLFFRSGTTDFGVREGYIVVAAAWIISSIIGAFPYYLSGAVDNYISAFFEAVSGFTTTGCTCIKGPALNHSLLLWKAISNWLGGMGILVFVISVLPALGISGQFIVRAETPGPVYEKTTVRISNSARMLYVTYATFTVIEFILLLISRKMSLLDCIILTLGSVSTGGVITNPLGLSYYDSLYVEIVVSAFCILSSINFILYYHLVRGRITRIIRDIEVRAFFIIIGSGALLCAFCLTMKTDLTAAEALRESVIQMANICTTSGFVRDVSFTWPTACQFIFLGAMIIGGCAASTSGSLKVVRFLVMLKLIGRGCIRRIHPRSVVAVKIGGESVSAPVVSAITVFSLTYFGLILLSALILSLQGHDMETNMTTAIAMLSNTGTAFTSHVSTGNFSDFNSGLKLYLSFIMITGRLELFTIIILLTRSFWGRSSR
ncbi:MAG: potassium transporter TrkG [Bacillota bacterium]|nr:potassium transporter TrkG [Bacillota bacterium]